MSEELQNEIEIPLPSQSPKSAGSIDDDDSVLSKKRRVNREVQAYIELTAAGVAAVSNYDGEDVDQDQGNMQQAQLPVKKRRAAVTPTSITNFRVGNDEVGNEDKDESKLLESDVSPVVKGATSSHPNNFDLRWQERLNDLRHYKALHGNCLVSKSTNFQLGKWVARQRQEYKKLQQGKKSCMTPERIKVLEDEGFTWVVREPYKQCPWDQRFDELIKFHNEKGTTVVSKNLDGHYQLSLWCMNQRQEYRKFKEGKKHMLTDERIEKLNSIGFLWAVKGFDTVPWEERLVQLRDFKAEFGHCNVPIRSDNRAKLGEWVKRMRAAYRDDFLYNKPSSKLTEEKVLALEQLGFDWDPSAKEVPWEQRYAELCEYKDKTDSCLVPQHYAENHQLGNWVSTQRNEFKKLTEGSPSSMTEVRIKLLDRIGFVWKAQKGRKTTCHDDGNDHSHMISVESVTPLLKPDQLGSDVASALPATAATLLSMELDGNVAQI